MDFEELSEKEILKELEYYQKQDYKYKDGKILGSMCTEPHPLAKKVFIKFLDSNLGDPGLFPGTKTLEDKTIKLLGEMLGLKNATGNIVTGGTEANLMAIRGARNQGINNGIKNPEIIVPKSAHFSFKKAEDLLNIKLIEAPLTKDYKVDTDFVENNITKNTVAIVGIAGSTELGKIDDIETLSNISLERDVHLHVDAAFGGFVIPFLKKYNNTLFDFRLPGVDSMTVDPHKMGLAPIPSGGIIFRNSEVLDAMAVETPYLTYKTQSTIVGTRLGASSAATYAVMKHLGYKGYEKFANEAMENTIFLAKELEKLGYELVCSPELNILGFNYPGVPTNILANEIRSYGWMVSESNYPKSIRIVLMRHIKRKDILNFIEDLKNIKDKLN